MSSADRALLALQLQLRASPFFYRLTLGTRVLLAAGFVPTGLAKLLGRPFMSIGVETPLGSFFETLYQSGPFWHFIGAIQVIAGLLVLWPATATLGAVLFLPVISSIFVITLSYDFNYTPVITGGMLLANCYLLMWDYHRLRGILRETGDVAGPESFPRQRLAGTFERAAYVGGAVTGISLFAGTRGFVPAGWMVWLMVAATSSFLAAVAGGVAVLLRDGRESG